MNWAQIISGALYAAFGVSAIGYCLAAIGLNVHFGYTGLLNFGQAGFALVGAYSIAMPIRNWDWNLFACIPVLIVMTSVFALLLGIPTLRLRSDYLAIVTIAAAEILRLVVSAPKWVGATGATDARSVHAVEDAGQRLRPVGHHLWMGTRRRAVGGGVLADAQSVGTCAAQHSRGRGRSAQPREECVRLQDVDPRDRWRDRRLRRGGAGDRQPVGQPD
jgi:branched-subunit amino acid ABC-type transport system permease component